MLLAVGARYLYYYLVSTIPGSNTTAVPQLRSSTKACNQVTSGDDTCSDDACSGSEPACRRGHCTGNGGDGGRNNNVEKSHLVDWIYHLPARMINLRIQAIVDCQCIHSGSRYITTSKLYLRLVRIRSALLVAPRALQSLSSPPLSTQAQAGTSLAVPSWAATPRHLISIHPLRYL